MLIFKFIMKNSGSTKNEILYHEPRKEVIFVTLKK